MDFSLIFSLFCSGICRPAHPNQVSPRFANESLGTGSGKGHGNKGSGGSGDKGVQKGSGKRAHGVVDVTDNEGEKPGKKAKTTAAAAAAEGDKGTGDKGTEGQSEKDAKIIENKIANTKPNIGFLWRIFLISLYILDKHRHQLILSEHKR